MSGIGTCTVDDYKLHVFFTGLFSSRHLNKLNSGFLTLQSAILSTAVVFHTRRSSAILIYLVLNLGMVYASRKLDLLLLVPRYCKLEWNKTWDVAPSRSRRDHQKSKFGLR